MRIVILCGGLGTRLGPLARERPKYLVPILGRPFCDWQLELLLSQGFDQFTLCIGHLGAQIKSHVEYRWRDLDVKFSDEGGLQRGPWQAYRRARIKDRHAVIYGDSYLPLTPEFVKKCWDDPRRVYLRWRGEDFGIRFLSDAKDRRTLESPIPWHEVGTPEGIAELENYLQGAAG